MKFAIAIEAKTMTMYEFKDVFDTPALKPVTVSFIKQDPNGFILGFIISSSVRLKVTKINKKLLLNFINISVFKT